MSIYGWILGLSIIAPLIFSFHPQLDFFRKWKNALLSGFIVAIPFWIWDAIAIQRGDWSFNPKFVGQIKIVGMPVEEILFFLIIPFCCLFIWRIIEKNVKDKQIIINGKVWAFAAIMAVILALIFRDKFYTSTVLWWFIVTVPIATGLSKDLFNKLNYWRWMAITFIPFSIVNGILTYLPVVQYSSQAIIGIRLVTIPIEDYLYSWCLLTLNLVVFEKLNQAGGT